MKHMKWLVPLAVVVLLLMIAIPAAADDPFGGPPSKTSGNGTSTWAAIYIGGTWDNKCDGVFKNPDTFNILTGNQSTKEYNCYVTNWSASTTIPGGAGSRWFKFDTVKSRDVEVYVDDDPKWGAAYRYFDDGGCRFNGVGDCDKADNLLRIGIDTSWLGKQWFAQDDRYDFATGNANGGQNGILARAYTPEAIMRPSYFWPVPNNALLTTRVGSQVRVGDTQGALGGYVRGNRSVINEGDDGTLTAIWLGNGDVNKAGDGNTHLLASKFHWDGWSYVRVFNYMYWDQNIKIGTRYTPNGKYDFPCANCPYPLNP